MLGDVSDEDEVLLQRPRTLAHRRLAGAAAHHPGQFLSPLGNRGAQCCPP